jgi:hypothetical protein
VLLPVMDACGGAAVAAGFRLSPYVLLPPLLIKRNGASSSLAARTTRRPRPMHLQIARTGGGKRGHVPGCPLSTRAACARPATVPSNTCRRPLLVKSCSPPAVQPQSFGLQLVLLLASLSQHRTGGKASIRLP